MPIEARNIYDGIKPYTKADSDGGAAVTANEADKLIAGLAKDYSLDDISGAVSSAASLKADARSMINGALLRARQNAVVADMKAQGVSNVENPPSAQNLKDYFTKLKGQPNATIVKAWEGVSKAFFVDSFKTSSPKDVQYTAERSATHSDKAISAKITTPQSIDDVTKIKASANGVRTIDCDGFAYLAGECFKLAGFTVKGYASAQNPEADVGHVIVVVVPPKTKGQTGQEALVVDAGDVTSVSAKNDSELKTKVATTISSAMAADIGKGDISVGKSLDDATVAMGNHKYHMGKAFNP